MDTHWLKLTGTKGAPRKRGRRRQNWLARLGQKLGLKRRRVAGRAVAKKAVASRPATGLGFRVARLVNPIALGAMALGLASCSFFFDYEPPGPEAFPIKGIDVSYYQEDIDWQKVRRSNTSFAWIKVTEGGDWSDPKFEQNWYEAAAAGVARGAYHFWYFCRPAQEQVSWFIEHVPYDPNALPPVLDMEWTASKTCPDRPSRATVLSEMKIWLDAIEAYYGKRPVIYTSVDFYRDRLRGAFPDYHMWVRSVRGHPMIRYGDLKWHFWQHTEDGRIAGIRGRVDRNVFYGTKGEWQEFLAGELKPED
jgi:lysozyme